MIVAAEYPFLEIFWTMIFFFWWLIWVWAVVMVLVDVFGRRDLSGWAKAAWAAFIIALPLLGLLIYLGKHGKDIGERRSHHADKPLVVGPRDPREFTPIQRSAPY
jgi:purine-cytosine permease-like protein